MNPQVVICGNRMTSPVHYWQQSTLSFHSRSQCSCPITNPTATAVTINDIVCRISHMRHREPIKLRSSISRNAFILPHIVLWCCLLDGILLFPLILNKNQVHRLPESCYEIQQYSGGRFSLQRLLRNQYCDQKSVGNLNKKKLYLIRGII
jgi:hypothetical protein